MSGSRPLKGERPFEPIKSVWSWLTVLVSRVLPFRGLPWGINGTESITSEPFGEFTFVDGCTEGVGIVVSSKGTDFTATSYIFILGTLANILLFSFLFGSKVSFGLGYFTSSIESAVKPTSGYRSPMISKVLFTFFTMAWMSSYREELTNFLTLRFISPLCLKFTWSLLTALLTPF